MKITLLQALATVLHVEIVNSSLEGGSQMFARVQNGNETFLGFTDKITLQEAINIAYDVALVEGKFDAPSDFAIFPIKSGREGMYMEIEAELLRQESHITLQGKQMWEQLPQGDPRQIVMMLMEYMRECAQAIINPLFFRTQMLRVCCLAIASLQWTQDWIEKIQFRNAALRSKLFDPRNSAVEAKEQFDGRNLTGREGEKEIFNGDLENLEKIILNKICTKHNERKPCLECEREERGELDFKDLVEGEEEGLQ